MQETKQAARAILLEAFNHLQSALELLDRAGAPGHIAANVDLSVNQLLGELAPAESLQLRSLLADPDNLGTARPS